MNKKQSKSNSNVNKTAQMKKKPPGAFHRKVVEPFRLKLKHVLGGVSFLSLLAAFEVFSIPAASGIIDLFGLTRLSAGGVWIMTALLSSGIAVVLDAEEKDL